MVQSASGGEGSGLSCLFVGGKWIDRVYRHCRLLIANDGAIACTRPTHSTMLSITKAHWLIVWQRRAMVHGTTGRATRRSYVIDASAHHIDIVQFQHKIGSGKGLHIGKPQHPLSLLHTCFSVPLYPLTEGIKDLA